MTTFFWENTMILGPKIRNPKLNSKKDLFLENTTILGRKIKNSRLNSSENLFFLENTFIKGQKLVYVLEPTQFSVHKFRKKKEYLVIILSNKLN